MWYVPLNVLLFCYMYMDVIGVSLFYAANTTLVCDLSDIKYVVFLYLSCICPETDISVTMRSIGVKLCMMVELNPGRVFSPFGGD